MSATSDQPVRAKRARGFALIEALVATVVFSIGLIGLGILHTKGLQFSRNAYVRTQATVLARELADRMRANAVAAEQGLYVYSASSTSPDTVTETDCAAEDCTPADLATYDLAEWWTKINSELPTASVNVTQNGLAGYRITLFWDDTGSPSGTPSCPTDNVTDSSGWQCYRLRYIP